MQFILVGWRLLFSQHSFQEFTFLWSCSNCSNDWEGSVPSALLTASRTSSQGRFVFHGCSGPGAEGKIAQRPQKGKREEPVSWESWGLMLEEKNILAAQMEWAWARGKSRLQQKEDVTIVERGVTGSSGEQDPSRELELGGWEMQLPAQRGPGAVGKMGAAATSSKVRWGRHTGAVPGRPRAGAEVLIWILILLTLAFCSPQVLVHLIALQRFALPIRRTGFIGTVVQGKDCRI